ncbi:ANTAR domain-containing protein, partial [Streptomyces scabiei]|uniref:ANTAR domain-containing protein n=1 Tax=Streptomyces scabiei TaxID=1930 RepID=UPI0039EF1387
MNVSEQSGEPGGMVRREASGPAGMTPLSPVGRLAATVDRLSREVRAAQAEAEGRALIELAKGILVARLGCGPAEAARQLAELAEQSQVTPLEFAVEVINQSARDRMSEVTDAFLAATAAVRTADPGNDTDDTDGEGTAAAGAAGEAAESAAVRLRAAESGALAADDTQAVADALLEQALRPLGAVAVAIWAAGYDGSLTLVGSAGFPPAEAARWRYVPPDVATVARRGLTERAGQWITSLAGTGLPSVGRHQYPDGGRAALPAGTGGRVHGVLEIAWPMPLAPQPPQVVRQVEALAELCAHTLES